MEKRYVVDRIEGGVAVLETESLHHIHVPLADLPPDAREGDCLREENGSIHPDPEETARRRAYNQALFRRLMERPSPGEEEE